MHEYATNGVPRKNIIIAISIISLIIFLILYDIWGKLIIFLMSQMGYIAYLPFIAIINISYSAVFGVLFFLFNKNFWKIHWFKYKNLSGNYHCIGTSYRDGNCKEYAKWEAEITIKQTWSHICISLETTESKSASDMARIFNQNDGSTLLHYCYTNDRKSVDNKLNGHVGTAEIIFGKNEIVGKYYNYPDDRNKYGSMILTKKESKNEI